MYGEQMPILPCLKVHVVWQWREALEKKKYTEEKNIVESTNTV